MSFQLNDFYMDKLSTFSTLNFTLLDKLIGNGISKTSNASAAGSVTISPRKVNNIQLLIPKAPLTQMKRPVSVTPKAPQPKKMGYLGGQAVQTSLEPTNVSPKKQLWASCVLDGQKMFMCALCVYKTKNNSDIHRHCRTKHPQSMPCFKCRSCDFSTADRLKLKNHYMKSHNLDEMIAKAAVDATPITQ